MLSSLTQSVLHYKKTGDGIDSIVNRVSILAYEYPKRFRGMSREACSDFYCSFRPKMIPMIDRFEYQEKPFEMYLYSTMKWHLKGFIRKQRKHETADRVFMQPTFWEETLVAREPSEPIMPQRLTKQAEETLGVDSDGHISEPAVRKRLLCLTLKGGESLSYSKLKAMAQLTECDIEWLCASLGVLRESRSQNYRRKRLLETRRNAHYLKISFLEDQWQLTECPDERRRISDEIETEHQILSKINRLISRTRLAPTHQAISRVTGIPKGTVDSGLYTIRKILREDSPPSGEPEAEARDRKPAAGGSCKGGSCAGGSPSDRSHELANAS